MPQFARWITERDYRAALMAAGLAMLPLLAPLSCAVLALTGLQRGAVAGWRAAAMGVALIGAVVWASGAHPAAGVLSALSVWAPTLAVTQILISSGSLSVAVRLATVGALVLAGGWAALAPVEGAPWHELVSAIVAPFAGQAGLDAGQMADMLLPLLPGIIAASLLLVSLGGLFLAMWLHAGLAQPGAFGEAFRALQLGPVLGGVAALAMTGALFAGLPVAAAMAIPAIIALVLQGIAVMHHLVRQKGLHRAWLLAGWGVLVLLSPWALIGFACYGLVDTLFDLRRRGAGQA